MERGTNPTWEVMLSFAGSLRKEAKKIADEFVRLSQGKMKNNDIFFDDWTLPRCSNFMDCCKIGILRSKKVVFIISSEFLDKERKLSTFLEWIQGIRNKDPKSVLVVLYQKGTERKEVLTELGQVLLFLL